MGAYDPTAERIESLVREFHTTTARMVAVRLQAQHYAKDRAGIVAQLGEYLSVAEIAGIVSEPPSEVEAMMRSANPDQN